MKAKLLGWVFLTFLFLNCSAGASNPLIGVYASEPDGNPNFRISQADGQYWAELFEDGKWSAPKKLEESTDKDIAKFFGEDMVGHVDTGLISKNALFAVFKIDDEFKVAGDRVNSDYMAIMLFPFPVYKL
ncbi:hypothetical protein [Flagellimonas beolgyonensis]|uniref:hypothetical protein n=1 Tax=Flagellimonas beolgyonensis TaxID=864064 RepID=UPI000F8F46C8|nr:hypothetical protein [Allomuricauda beolgyonensis]